MRMCNLFPFFFFFFFFGKGYEKTNSSTQIVGIGDFCPQKSWEIFLFKILGTIHPSIHPYIHLFLKKIGWSGPRVRKDGFVVGTRHPLQAQNVHNMSQTCVLPSSIHPSIFFCKKDGWIEPRVDKDGFVMGTRCPYCNSKMCTTWVECVSKHHTSIHPSIHPLGHYLGPILDTRKKKKGGLISLGLLKPKLVQGLGFRVSCHLVHVIGAFRVQGLMSFSSC